MNKVKSEHYVPQFYLKRFSKNGDGRIDVYDKTNDKELLNQSSENFACERYYYDVNNNQLKENLDLLFDISKGQYSEEEIKKIKDNDQLIENMFARMEAELSGEFQRLEKDFNVINEPMFRVKFHIFIRDLAIRTDAYRNQIQMITEKTMETAKKLGAKEVDGYDINMDSKEIAKLKQLDLLTSLPELVRDGNRFLNNYNFYIGINNTNMSFIISDHPSINVFLGFNDICFPISPTLAIIMRVNVDGAKFILKDEPNRDGIIELSEQSVLAYNCFQFVQARRFVFGDMNVIKRIALGSKLSELLRELKQNK